MIGCVLAVVIGVIFVLLFLICYLKSKGKYDEYIEYVDKEELSLIHI